MILQMLPGPISQAAENFAQMFLAQQRLEQEERTQDLRERELKLRQDALEQEQIERQAAMRSLLESQAGMQAAAQMPAAVQQIATAPATEQQAQAGQVPVQQVAQQAARRQIESPEASPVQRTQAGQQLGLTPEQARSAGREATLDERIEEVTGQLPEPFQELGGRFMQVASQVGTENARLLFEQQFERIREQNPTEAEQLDEELTRLRIEEARETIRTRRRQRQVAEQELDNIATPEDVVTALTGLPGSTMNEEEAATLVSGLGVENAQTLLRNVADGQMQEHQRFRQFALNFMFGEDPATGGLTQTKSLSDARRVWQSLGRGPGTPDETFQQDLAVTVGAAELPDSDGGEEITDTEKEQIRQAIQQKWQGLVEEETIDAALTRALGSDGRNLNLTEEERGGFDSEEFFGPGFEESPSGRFFSQLGRLNEMLDRSFEAAGGLGGIFTPGSPSQADNE